MPSGAKKRKAAKKKKEQGTNNINSSTNNNPYGNEKSQDERDSDGGSVDSPASQDDHSHQHPFNRSEAERKIAPSHVESHVTEDKSAKETTRDAKRTEKYGSDDAETTHVHIQHVEYDKSSSCSSSSDDESRAFKKKSKEEAYNIGSEETSYGNEDKLATIVSEEVQKVAENGTHGVESRLKESEEKLLPSSNGISKVEMEGKVFPSSSTPPAETSNVVEKSQDSEPHDYSKNKPFVASTQQMVQRTSLLSCCGLFDVLTGSGR